MDPQEYSQRLNTIVANGFITCALSIGKDLGIFDALKKLDKPVTSQELASQCVLKERYVQEWLGAMVAANIIEMEGDSRYFIPFNCKDCLGPALTFANGPTYLSMMYFKLIECFKKDGPKGYSYLDMERKVLDWIDSATTEPDKLVLEVLEKVGKFRGTSTIKVMLEVGCGQGRLARAFSRIIPDTDFYAIDFNPESIEKAKTIHQEENLCKCNYQVEDVGNLPASWTGKFDFIMMNDVLHDLPNPLSAITEIRRVLKGDGIAVITDPGVHSSHKDNKGDVMTAAIGYTCSCFICLPSSMNMDNAAALGVGWGMERKQTFLEENGFVVKEKCSLLNEDFEKSMFCMKK